MSKLTLTKEKYLTKAEMGHLKKAGITLNRKMLSEIAIADPAAFTALVEQAKNA